MKALRFKILLNSLLTVTAMTPSHIGAETLDVMTLPEPVTRVSPNYPAVARSNGLEGWVRVSYVVDEKGTVKDAFVEDSSGFDAFEDSALEAVGQWKYKPATVNGDPVEQCRNGVQLNFRLSTDDTYHEDKKNSQVNKRFHSRFKRGMDAVEKGKMEDAWEKIEQLQQRRKRNWIENSYLWVLEAYYFEKANKPIALEKSLNRIKNNGAGNLPKSLYVEMLKKLFVAEVSGNKLANAKHTFEALQAYSSDSPVTQQMLPYYQQVNAFIEGPDPLEVVAQLSEAERWSHNLSRKTFQIQSNEKPLQRVEIRCDNKRSVTHSVSQKAFEIPESWGQCRVFVSGEKGTQFSLFELQSS